MKEQLSVQKQEELISENQNLVFYVVNRLNIPHYLREDYVSEGNEVLTRVAKYYDSSKGVEFSTYAVKSLQRALYEKKKQEEKFQNDISLYTEYGKDDNIFMIDFISDTKVPDYTDLMIQRETIALFLNVLLNFSNAFDKMVMLYRLSGKPQKEVATMYGCCLSNIPMSNKRVRNSFQKYLDNNIVTKGKFTVLSSNGYYWITQKLSEDDKIEVSFAESIKAIVKAKKIPGFKLKIDKESISMRLPPLKESFLVLIEWMKEMHQDK